MSIKMKFLHILALYVGVVSLLICSGLPSQSISSTDQSPALIESVYSHSVNVTGQVIDSEGYRILSDFVAVAVNNATGDRVLSNAFNTGEFRVTIYVPGFADDNQTIYVQVMSKDQKTIYGGRALVLSDLNHTSAYALTVTVPNPPPNYNALILIFLFLLFALILAGYILFTKWLVRRAVLMRADDIMIKRSGGIENQDPMDVDGDDEQGEEEESEDEPA
jgi:hypothetical protein